MTRPVTRRDFLAHGIAASALAFRATDALATNGSSAASRPLRLLILGGTGNIGPFLVRAAVTRGHHVAVFSRGLRHADLPGTVERLRGDRNGNLSSIRGRDWDAVLDIATFAPGWVRTLGEALKGRVGQYAFVSTVSVYDRPEMNEVTREDSRVLSYRGSADPYSVTTERADYGALKVLCEHEAQRQFPESTLIVRPGYIAGPGDQHAALPYWVLRMERGGEALAAGDPGTPVQFIDVRDLAGWTVLMIERRATGTYNAIGPATPASLGAVVGVARASVSVPPAVTWVPSRWLTAQADWEPFGGLLFWELNQGNLSRISNARARAHGLAFRPIGQTLADTLRWYHKQPAQQEIRIGYRSAQAGGGWEPISMPWAAYLARERSLLASWHAQQQRQQAAV